MTPAGLLMFETSLSGFQPSFVLPARLSSCSVWLHLTAAAYLREIILTNIRFE